MMTLRPPRSTRRVALPGLVALCLLPGALAAQPLACPAPAALVQLAPCPSDQQLHHGYVGYCSDNRRLYAPDHDTCTSFENYRRVKNITRWESADGVFEGYLSCQEPATAAATLPPPALSIARQGTITRVVCRYGDSGSLSHRTKARCALVDPAACAADAAACRARCE